MRKEFQDMQDAVDFARLYIAGDFGKNYKLHNAFYDLWHKQDTNRTITWILIFIVLSDGSAITANNSTEAEEIIAHYDDAQYELVFAQDQSKENNPIMVARWEIKKNDK